MSRIYPHYRNSESGDLLLCSSKIAFSCSTYVLGSNREITASLSYPFPAKHSTLGPIAKNIETSSPKVAKHTTEFLTSSLCIRPVF